MNATQGYRGRPILRHWRNGRLVRTLSGKSLVGLSKGLSLWDPEGNEGDIFKESRQKIWMRSTRKPIWEQPYAPRDRPPSSVSSRRHDLDALRAFAMLLGLIFHSSLPYATARWMVSDWKRNEGLLVFVSWVHGFRMPLFVFVEKESAGQTKRSRFDHEGFMERAS